MKLLVCFPIIATAIAASIPYESSNVIRRPSLTHPVAVAGDDEEGRNLEVLGIGIQSLAGLKLQYIWMKTFIKLAMVSCIFNPGTNCPFDIPDLYANSFNLENFAIGDHEQIKSFDESFKFPPATTIAKNAVFPNHQRNPFLVTVPTFWNPYVNVPLVAFHREMANSAVPSTGSFIPYLNGIPRFNNPSLMDTVAPHTKLPVPVGGVSETTP